MIDRRAFVGSLFALGACATLPVAPAETRPLWNGLTPGPYDPGFELGWVMQGSRPVQRWRWFPARRGSGQAMRVADYGAAFVAGGAGDWPTDPARVYATGFDEPGDAAKLAVIADIPVAARKSASPARVDAPLVVIAQGWAFESPYHQHVLAEYLASWGAEVISAPLVGVKSIGEPVSPETLAAQVGDLSALLAGQSPSRRLGLIGFDLGGMAVTSIAGEGLAKPGLLVGIDTGLLSKELTDKLTLTRAFDWDRLSAPYLHVTRTAAENLGRKQPEDDRIFRLGSGPRFMLRVPGMRHADFASIGALEGVHPGLYGTAPGKAGEGNAATIFVIGEAVRHFLAREGGGAWQPLVPTGATLERLR